MSTDRCCEESGLLASLWEIRTWAKRQELDHVRNLTNVACLIGNRFFCDVCSIYRVDHAMDEVVLAATVGLRQDCVGRLRLRVGEGLCGHVAEMQTPLMIEMDAMQHAQFRYFPEAGEEPYESFLGVPVESKDALEGVLVVQTMQPRNYTVTEIQMLSLAADLMAPALRNLAVPEHPEVLSDTPAR